MKQPSLLGGAMIVAGTTIGAGMLANPTATSGVWFVGSVVALIYTWVCMTASGLMLPEGNLYYPEGGSFYTMVRDLRGGGWNRINGLAMAFTLYILTYAYITSGGGITERLLSGNTLQVSHSGGALLFCGVLTFAVWLSTKAVDRFSTVLIGGMVIAFFFSTAGMLSGVKAEILFNTLGEGDSHYLRYLWVALPVCLVSFGFHCNVPSLTKYYHKDAKKVSRAILIGTGLALLMYLLWQAAVQGNLPRGSFAEVTAKGGDVATLLAALGHYIRVDYVAPALDFFAYMAIASSFLGATLGLFDYIADLFKFNGSLWGRTKTALVTFLPPLAMSLLYPYGFVKAICYAGLAVAIWTVIVPALLVRAFRKRHPEGAGYRVWGGEAVIWAVLAFGLLNILAMLKTLIFNG